MCFACLKWVLPKRRLGTVKPSQRSIRPGSMNNSTLHSSLQICTPTSEVNALMSQVEKSRRNTYHSQPSGPPEVSRTRRYSDSSEEYFEKIIQKRPKGEMISKECFQLYKEVSGMMILDHQLRQPIRRTPPVTFKEKARQKTW